MKPGEKISQRILERQRNGKAANSECRQKRGYGKAERLQNNQRTNRKNGYA